MASIGAKEMSELAKSHEFEAKAKNTEYITRNGKMFIEKYETIIDFIGENIEIESEKTEETTCVGDVSAVDVSRIKKIIDEAIADIDDFESDAAVEKLNKLKESL